MQMDTITTHAFLLAFDTCNHQSSFFCQSIIGAWRLVIWNSKFERGSLSRFFDKLKKTSRNFFFLCRQNLNALNWNDPAAAVSQYEITLQLS